MVVEHGERRDPSALNFQRTFEVALPKLIRNRSLKKLNRSRFFFGNDDAVIATQDVGERANRRQRVVMRSQHSPDFARTPTLLIANSQRSVLNGNRRLVR